ncbi:unnamed protein product, partial [Amoebophrya sp. A25]
HDRGTKEFGCGLVGCKQKSGVDLHAQYIILLSSLEQRFPRLRLIHSSRPLRAEL